MNSKINSNHSFSKTQKALLGGLVGIIVAAGLVIGIIIICNDKPSLNQDAIIEDQNDEFSGITIDLDLEASDVYLREAGNYRLTGKLEHSLIIDAEASDVEILFDGVEISSADKAAIIGLAAEKIILETAPDPKNILSDGGTSEYDGCIFSNAELIFAGEGTLTISDNQTEGEGIASEAQDITFESGTYVITANDDGINAGGDGATITFNGGEFYIDASGDGIDSNKDAIINGGTIFVMGSDTGGDAGIDTDDGFEINGGTVIALGSDMVESPLASSTQNSFIFTLDETIKEGTLVTLMCEDTEIISFIADKSFRTLILSLPTLETGDYQLYTGGMHSGTLRHGVYYGGVYTKGTLLSINSATSFTVSSTVNQYDDSGPGNGMGSGRPPMYF